ncbi:hypothetical protein A3F64_02305 [Candidatus Saccharibacteria bacterium RIFCSPHIGHO2_12_FULL_42_8]|nr:MAG: hypothetical protein A3F64_02305 [Candidatus Saccharibacteria bacterium RIFCSPHIGHO2_12_FULL_42_8]
MRSLDAGYDNGVVLESAEYDKDQRLKDIEAKLGFSGILGQEVLFPDTSDENAESDSREADDWGFGLDEDRAVLEGLLKSADLEVLTIADVYYFVEKRLPNLLHLLLFESIQVNVGSVSRGEPTTKK